MSAIILNGKEVSNKIRKQISEKVSKNKLKPKMAVVFDSGDSGSVLYVNMKEKAANKVGIDVKSFDVNGCHEQAVFNLIEELNENDEVGGILVQAPIAGIDTNQLFNAIKVEKDIDGLSELSQGKLLNNSSGNYSVAATPLGVIRLLREYKVEIEGKSVLILGRSRLFGKPMSALFTNNDATVTIAHSRTNKEYLTEQLKNADIVVSGVGKPNLINGKDIKQGAIAIDVGMNVVDGKAVGDMNFDSVKEVASYITPTPGGTGPMTIAILLENLVKKYI